MDEKTQRVLDKIGQEIADAKAKIVELRPQFAAAQDERDALDVEERKVSGDQPLPPELQTKVDSATRKVFGIWDAIRAYEAKIKTLESPQEFDRRMNVAERISDLRERTGTMSKETARDQNVPEVYLNSESGNFKPGMDARYKSDLVLSAIGEITKDKPGNSLQVFTKADAEKRLAQRNWMSFLENKKRIVAEKAEKAEKAKAAREQQQREKAEAKKAAAEQKKAEKAEAAKAEKKNGNGNSKADQDRAQREAKVSA